MLNISSQKKKPNVITNDALPGFDPAKGEHPRYTTEYWKSEVAYNLTRMGYWQWVKVNLEQDELHNTSKPNQYTE